MCRFLIYHGPPLRISQLVREPNHSLIRQSFRSAERVEPLNGDGFGIAWYVPDVSPEPALFRSITPAWSNQNLLHLARVTVSPCVLGHVRAASPGLAVTETNAHPFVFGRYAFMHNGESFVACRYATVRPEAAPSLHLHAGRRYVCENGASRMVEHSAEGPAVIVASEALSNDPSWQLVEPGNIVLVNAEREAVVRALAV